MKTAILTLGPLFSLLLACGAQDAPLTDVEATRAIVGENNQVDPDAYIPAVARILIGYPAPIPNSLCSGSLVAANKILTAAHCFCPKNGAALTSISVDFAGANGVIAAGSPVWSGSSFVVAPNAFVCGEWGTASADDPQSHGASDVAVITLAPNAVAPVLPPIAPTNVFLGDPFLNLATGPNPNLAKNFRIAGYGTNLSNNPFVSAAPCLGCNIRRSGPNNPSNGRVSLLTLRLVSNPCEVIPFTRTKAFPQNCFSGRQWGTMSADDGELIEFAPGDSGGPLMFNLNNPTLPAVQAGVASSWYSDSALALNDLPEGTFKWATTGDNADFLWGALGLPFTLTLAQLQAGTAIYTKEDLSIDDRGHVVANNPPSPVVGSLVANGPVYLGTDSVVGDVKSRAQVQIRDRARAGNVVSNKDVVRGSSTTVASVAQGVFQKFEDFGVSAPFSPPNTNLNIDSSMTLAPGIYGNVIVNGGAVVTLTDGLYVFRSFAGNSGSTLRTMGTRTWLFVTSNSWFVWRNNVVAPTAGSLFVGLPNAAGVTIGNNFVGTLVAPTAFVDVDMVNQAVFVGSVFARGFRLHQGQFFKFAPFTGRFGVPTCTSGGGFQTCN